MTDVATPIRPPRVVVAGQKLQFITDVVEGLRAGGAVVEVDEWQGQTGHDEARSRYLAAWADVVIAEWCLGNAVWYAAHRTPRQRVFVHFHRYELETEQPRRLDAEAIDGIVFVGSHFAEAAAAEFGWPTERCLVVPNPVDTARFAEEKRPEAEWTLGLLQYHRRLKRLDWALDVLERARREDPRFRLSCKGPDPRSAEDAPDDPEEARWFERVFERIGASPALAGGVDFVEAGPDVDEWFRGVGYVLSPSDVESFHLALAEGMASRAVPLIRRREGVGQLWRAEWVHDDASAMAAEAVRLRRSGERAAVGERARRWIRDRYELGLVTLAWEALVWDWHPDDLLRVRRGVGG